jgi:phosphate transport system substrate-binding protein
MISRRILLVLAAAILCGTSVACSGSGNVVTIQGSGATFPAPLYKRWFLEYYKRDPNVRVNYQGIGSGAGIRQFTEGLTTFGASDAAMNDKEEELFKKQRGVDAILLPMTAGSIVLCYNLPSGLPELKLSRKTYVKIFLGEIRRWDDKAIAETNPGVALPAMPITVGRRADGSGTTYVFTKHLDTVGKRVGVPWKPGVGKSIRWPEGMLGARGNDGVAQLIQQTPGAIGYLEFGYAELSHLPTALLENKSGTFVKATPETSEAALAGAKLPPDFRIWISDPDGKEAYPIVTYTWMLCATRYRDARMAEAMKKVLRFCLTEGQKFSPELGYIALPKNVADPVLAAVERIGAGPSESVALRKGS